MITNIALHHIDNEIEHRIQLMNRRRGHRGQIQTTYYEMRTVFEMTFLAKTPTSVDNVH